MLRLYFGTAIQIRDCPRDLADAVIAARRQAEGIERLPHQHRARVAQLAEAAKLRRLHIGVAVAFGVLKSLALDVPRCFDPFLDLRRRLGRSVGAKLVEIERRNFHDNINTVLSSTLGFIV